MEESTTVAAWAAPRRDAAYRTLRGLALGLLLGATALAPAMAQEQLAYGPKPTVATAARPVDDTKFYRPIGARHLYDAYRHRIFKGQMPPLLYAITITEIELDEDGNVLDAVIVREPAAAKDVGPWVLALIRAASPFPKPGRPGRTRYLDTWLVDQSYTFQLDTLTEGQL